MEVDKIPPGELLELTAPDKRTPEELGGFVIPRLPIYPEKEGNRGSVSCPYGKEAKNRCPKS